MSNELQEYMKLYQPEVLEILSNKYDNEYENKRLDEISDEIINNSKNESIN